jgi:hypothetical protein
MATTGRTVIGSFLNPPCSSVPDPCRTQSSPSASTRTRPSPPFTPVEAHPDVPGPCAGQIRVLARVDPFHRFPFGAARASGPLLPSARGPRPAAGGDQSGPLT